MGLNIGMGIDMVAPMTVAKSSRLKVAKKILFEGSSSESARWTGDGAKGMDGARPFGYLMQAAAEIAARGINVNTQATFGDQANDNPTGTYSPANMALHDTRFHDFVNLQVNTTNSSMGGYPIRLPLGVNTDYRITFTQPSDKIILYSHFTNIASAQNRFIYSIDGGAETIITGADIGNTNAFKIEIPVALGIHTLRVRTPTTNANLYNINVLGVEAQNSTIPELRFIPAGARGWNTSARYWTRAGAYGPLTMLDKIRPDLLMMTPGGNEGVSGAAWHDAFRTNLILIGDTAVVSGAIPVFVAKPYMDNDYYAVIDEVNARYHSVDTYRLGLKSEAQAIADGEQAGDGLHWLKPWHAREGTGLGAWMHTTLFHELGWYN